MQDDECVHEALKVLRKAFTESINQNTNFTEEINQNYRKCKKKKWLLAEEKRRIDQSLTFATLKKLLHQDFMEKQKLESYQKIKKPYRVNTYITL